MKYHVKGWPVIGKKIDDMLNEAEWIHMPFFNRISAEDFRRYACNFQKYLLDSAPLTNRFRYVFIDFSVQLLYPGVSGIGRRDGEYRKDGWHVDGHPIMGGELKSLFHLIQNTCTANTVFNTEGFDTEIPDNTTLDTFNVMLNEVYAPRLKPQSIPGEAWVSFSDHPHRANSPEQIEFRFFFRITESDFMAPYPVESARIQSSNVHVFEDLKTARAVRSIEHRKDGVFLNIPIPHMQGKGEERRG